ncbi:BTB/POZ domain-containing protein 6-like [Haliotis rubra]|uniref:BTB/POZ domain-containing protein 6-like n=1 Tax=Haliotis rubra TaxID=36100 RepID=UPI001EE610ED|nr:BTB/POZ domain-containing protein 6-like [Haliotis rubra]
MASVEVSGENSGFVDNWQSGKTLAECNLHMLTSEDSCDVSFRVGQEGSLVGAHRYVLSSRSCVFYAMLCGPLAEKEDIKIPDVEEEVFSEMLRYLYTDKTTLTAENVTGLLYLAKKYSVGGLERLCVVYLESSLTAENACVILEEAHKFDEEKLFDRALEVIVKHCGTVVSSPGFTSLCASCFHKVVSSDTFLTMDETSFNAALLWAETECKRQEREITPENKRLVLGKTVYELDFTAMGMKVFAKVVVPSGILSGDECTKLLCHMILPGTDVAPFKIKPELDTWVTLYADRIDRDQCKKESNILIITCSQDMRLLGLLAYGDGSCKYSTCLYQEQERQGVYSNYTTTCTSKTWVRSEASFVLVRNFPNEVELKVSKALPLKSTCRYKIEITRESNKSGFSGSSVFSNITVGKCQLSIKEERGPGLISRLIMEQM